MSVLRKAKAEAKAEEKVEKELAKARVEVAHEVRLAKEAEAEMDLHVARAGMIAENEMAMYANNPPTSFVPSDAAAAAAAANISMASGLTMDGTPCTIYMAGTPASKKLL
ncbi:late embryogenesis abundant protein 6-like [Cucurbita pepo subsp. pepo]|uniref:late embryogenesis abundant protein 6-like n=1 Tax=Cucurbita pepo subsp. pepo TaxID=3664 RepID=UPI000C9D53C6|nr:late embryogenesis abundant protein 6-like [Cucurbita pepo subsp. pepo]